MAEWITDEDLAAALGVEPAETTDEDWLTFTVTAVNALVDRKRPDLAAATPGDHPDVCLGAAELGIKVYRSRGAANTSGQFDAYTYTARYLDANVALLLGLDGPVIA